MKVFCLILSLLVIVGCQDIGPQKKSLARISISNEGKRVGKNVEQKNLAQTFRKRKGKNIITQNPIRQKIEEKVRSEIENIIQNEIENVMSKIKRKGKKVIFSGSSPVKKVIKEANVQPHPNSRHSKKMILRKPTENKNSRNVNKRKNMNPEKRLGKNLDISVKGSNSKNNKSTGILNRTGKKIKSNPFGPMKRKGRRRQKKPKQVKRLRNTRKRKMIEQKAPEIITNTKTTNKNKVRNMKAKRRQSKNIKGSDIVSKNKENRSNNMRNGKLANLKRKGKKMKLNKKRNGQTKRHGKFIKQNRNLKKNTKPFNKLERNNENFNKRRRGRRIKIKNNDVLGRNRMQRAAKKPIHRRNKRSPIPLWKPVELEEDPIPQWKPVELEEEDSPEHLNLMNDSLTSPQPNTQGAGSTPGPGADSAPGPAADSVPELGADSTPGPGADSAPGPAADSVPEPGADSAPGPGADSTPGPEAGSAPGPEAGSTPGPGAGSTPAGPPEGRYSLVMNPYINLPPNIPRPVAGVGQLPPNFRLPLQRPPGPLQRIQPNAKPTLPSPPNAILTQPVLMEKIFRMFKSTEVRTALAELADSLYEQIDTTNIKLKNMLEQKVDGILKKMVMTIYEDTGVSVHDCLTKDYDISCISDDEDSPELPMETPNPSNDTQKKISIPDDKPVETIPKDLNETPLDNDENEISKDIPTSNNESLESPPKEQPNLDKDTPNESPKPNDEELTEIPEEAGDQSKNDHNETESGDTIVPSNSPDEAFNLNAEYESMVEPPTYLDISDYYSSPVNEFVSPIDQTSAIDSIIDDSSIIKDLEEQVKDIISETLNTLSGSENNLVDDSDFGISDDKLLDENHILSDDKFLPKYNNPDGNVALNDQSDLSDSNVVGDETDSILESSLMPSPTYKSENENDQFTIEEHESSAGDASDSSPDYYSQADYAPLLDYISSSGYGAMSNFNPSAEYIPSADYNPSADYISSADYNPIADPSADNNPASDYSPSADYAASWAYNPDVDYDPSADYSMNDLVDDVKDNPVADYSSSSDSSILDNNAPSAEEMPSNDRNSVDDLSPAAYYDSVIDYGIGEEYVLDGDDLTHQTPQLGSDILVDDSIDNIPLSDVLSKAHVSLTDSVSSTDQAFLADNGVKGDNNVLTDYSSSADDYPQGEYTSLSGNIPADYNELLDNSIDDNPQNDNTLTETIDADQIQPGEDVSLVEVSPIDKNVALISKPKDHEMAVESELEQANQELIDHKEKDSQHELEQANQELTEHKEKDSQHETPINVPTVDFRVQDEVAASLYDNYQNYAEATLSDNEIDAYYYDSSQNIASDNIDPNGDLPVPNALEINDKLVEAAEPSLYEDYY